MRHGAIVATAGLLFLCGCPGELDHPERFVVDAGCGDVEATIFKTTCGTTTCHENPGAANNLDLISPGVAGRIAAATSTCAGKSMKTFMLEKIKNAPSCGAKMPLVADPLTADQVKCVEQYLNKLGDGGV